MKRRQLLGWAAPTVTAITLPVHAQMTCEPSVFSVTVDSVTPSSGSVAANDTIAISLSYSISNPPADLSSISILSFFPVGSQGVFSRTSSITSPAGTLDHSVTYNTANSIVETNNGVTLTQLQAVISGTGNCAFQSVTASFTVDLSVAVF